MKKFLFPILVFFMIFLLSSAWADGETTTLLVYLCGTDLQEDACEDLIEMAEVENGDDINIVVLAGGAKEWALEDLKGSSRTLAVIRDGYFDDLQDWGYASMGSPDSLEEFLAYGMTEYPADRTIVVLWDHGAGSEGGICFDETANDDSLTVVEIDQVLQNLRSSAGDYHINIFGCDACMMATYEMAAMLARHPVGYYVASEELEPGTGWFYTDWLNLLLEDPSATDADVCTAIIESYMDVGLQNDPDDYLTLSAVDLSAVPALTESMEQFASVMIGQIDGGNLSYVRRGRSRMYTFGAFSDASWDMVDLGAMLDAYAQFSPDQAAEARRLLTRAVILSSQSSNLDTCSGLSILLPQDTTEYFGDYREGFDLSGIIPNWVEFVNGYVSLVQGGHYQFTASDVAPLTDTSGIGQGFTSFFSTLSPVAWNDDTDSYAQSSPEEGGEIAISDREQGFTATLPLQDLDYLDYVEGLLMMNISEDDSAGYVDFGAMQNNLIDWSTGEIVSLYDGTWPVFGGQPVPLYDQSSNEHSRRSLIPVKLNGEYTYLVVVFPAGGTEGRVIGANAGYDDNGLPIRNMTRLQPGDQIIPVYTLYYEEEGKEDLQETEFDGDAILWEEGMTVTYEDLSDETDPTEMIFCFVFNDIFGEYTMSELISFDL